jgi:hypothetical protein
MTNRNYFDIAKWMYKKLKSEIYHNRSRTYLRTKLADFEHDKDAFEKALKNVSIIIEGNQTEFYNDIVTNFVSRVTPYVIPKKFVSARDRNDIVNLKDENKTQIDKINLFINAPIEVLIIDLYWTVLIGKLIRENVGISRCSRGNILDDQHLYFSSISDDLLEGINFSNNKTFEYYFTNYSKWKDECFAEIEKKYENQEDTILLTTDFTGFFYSVDFDYHKLFTLFPNSKNCLSFVSVTEFMSNARAEFKNQIVKFGYALPIFNQKNNLLPIGLYSSYVLGDLYLREFDESMMKQKPVYYGRYVDDVLVVFNSKKISYKENKEKKFHDFLISTKVFAEDINEDWEVTATPNVKVQKQKVNVIFFDHTAPKTIIDIYNKKIRITPSSMNLLPSYNFHDLDFDENAYDLSKILDTNGKVREIDFLQTNNLKATQFLSNLLKTTKQSNVKKELKTFVPRIVKFYTSGLCLEYSNSWPILYNFLFVNKLYKEFSEVNKKINDKINGMKLSYELSTSTKKSYFQKNNANVVRKGRWENEKLNKEILIIKTEILEKSKAFLLSLNHISANAAVALDTTQKPGASFDPSLATKLREANLFDHKLISYPLINYIDFVNNDPLSLISGDLDCYAELLKHNELSEFKREFSPRFIYISELLEFKFLNDIIKNELPTNTRLDDAYILYKSINSIKFEQQVFESQENCTSDNYELNSITINDSGIKPLRDKAEIHIAVSSVMIDDQAKLNVKRNRQQFSDKKLLYQLLEDAVKNKSAYIVFPELFLQIQWLNELLDFSRTYSIGIIGGLDYIVLNKIVKNYVLSIQPFMTNGGFVDVVFDYREKNDYSPFEIQNFNKRKMMVVNPINPKYTIIQIGSLSYSYMLCYEITDIKARSRFKGKVDLIFLPVLNPDTTYFNSIIEACSRDLYCFVAQSNSSKYGDSRITGPYNSECMNIVQIKGGINDLVVVGKIDIDGLKIKRKTAIKDYVSKPQKPKDFTPKFKLPSART